MKQDDETIRVPIRGRYVYDRKTGQLLSKELEFADLPTAAVAEFLLARFGLDPEDLQQNKSPASIAARPGKGSS